jgi:hypothetical protein
MTWPSPTVLRNLTRFQDVVANPAASIAYQSVILVPMPRGSGQRCRIQSPSLAIVIPDFFSASFDRAARVCVWCERAFQSSIRSLNFSAPAHLSKDVQISDSASGCGRIPTGPVAALHQNCQAIDTVPQVDICASDSQAAGPLASSLYAPRFQCFASTLGAPGKRHAACSSRRASSGLQEIESAADGRCVRVTEGGVRIPDQLRQRRVVKIGRLNSFSPRRKANSA